MQGEEGSGGCSDACLTCLALPHITSRVAALSTYAMLKLRGGTMPSLRRRVTCSRGLLNDAAYLANSIFSPSNV